MRGPSPTEVVAAAVHDLRTGVGSIRLALTSVIDDDDDPQYRKTMLAGADDEVRRLNARLTVLPTLVAASCDRSRPQPQSLSSVLRAAFEEAARRQVVATLEQRTRLRVSSKRTLPAVLSALIVVATDGAGDVKVSVRKDRGRAIVRMARTDNAVFAAATFAERLALTAGIAMTIAEGALEVSLPLVT